jgi:prophage regulatory protein
MNLPHDDDERLVKLPEVMHLCAMSRSAVYAHMKAHDFPLQVKQSKRAVAWSHREVIAWLELKKRQRQNTPSYTEHS